VKPRAQKRRGASDRIETLQELRVQTKMTQVELAEVLGVTQATLSKLERRADVKVSTLRAYVESLGGELEIVAKLGDRSVAVELPYDPAPISR
jgi:transcriptional regulator with XRE-family HTH domain